MDLFSPPPDPAALRDKALAAHDALCDAYGCPVPFFSTKDPLSELVSALLSHRTKNADSARAYRQLRERFPTWEAVRDAPTTDVQAALAPCTWPEQKAPRVQAVLGAVTDAPETDGLSLDALADWPADQARRWLQQINGVGPNTSAAVLLFSRLRVPALPVDSHHHRVAQRLGLIPESMAVGPSHDALAAFVPADWDAQQVYDHHEVFMLHGQRCCRWRAPACGRCPVYDLCVWAGKGARGNNACSNK
ncbi:endonuclease III domain-containing protein [Rubrivirga sp. IMCC45206]|uniref:endonuclease III domain-containing protein n=1 Tax=Rubrivirga sp. IMCC45206 TaxID=3391614 RepID=UPI0039902F5B